MSILLASLALVATTAPEAVRLQKLGDCVVKRRPDAAAEYVLDIETDEAEARKMHQNLPLVRCWEQLVNYGGEQLRLPGDTLRYVLADALVRHELSDTLIGSFTGSPPLPRITLTNEPVHLQSGKKASAQKLAELADARRQALADIDRAIFGECVARLAPRDSHDLLMTKVGSPEESTRLGQLSRTFDSCMRSGQAPRPDSLEVRGPIALSYYRLVKSGAGE